MKKTLLIALFGVLLFGCGHKIVSAPETSSPTQIVPNIDPASDDITENKITGSKILVLYKERDPDHEGIVYYLTSLLEQAGFQWDKMDVEKLLAAKDKPDLSPYKGIMTCYQTSQMVGGDVYPSWLVKQMEAGRRILIIGSYGAYQALIPKSDGTFIEWNESTQTINTFFWPFGLEFLFGWTGSADKLAITHKDSQMVEYQAPLKPAKINYYQYYKSINPKNRVYLEVERKDMIDSKSALVVHTPFGGMLLESYGYFWDSKSKKMVQRVNMIKFIQEGLSGECPEVPKYSLLTHRELISNNPLPTIPPEIKWQKIQGEIKRHVLVPYKKAEAPIIEDMPLYNRAEIVLNHLGVILDYWPLEDGFPSEDQMEKYRGIITWHTTPFLSKANEYGKWLVRQAENGKKLVLIQAYGAHIDKDFQLDAKNISKVFSALGIEYRKSRESRIEYHPEIKKKDKDMVGFEWSPKDKYFEYTYQYVSRDPENKVYLSVEDLYNGEIDLIVTGPKGGIALGNSAYYFPSGDVERIEKVRQALDGDLQPELAEGPSLGAWIINPYRFFTEALGLDDIPAPDYTTINGSRIYYIHIDGDALNSISLIDKAHFAGKHVLEKHLRPYSDLPFSASIISKQIESWGNAYYNPLLELSKEIYRLPNVEVATHTTTHPFDWREGDPYIKDPKSYPWSIDYRQQDLPYEIWGTKLFIDKYVAPEGKKCDVLFWSGATNPDAKALELTTAAGLKNINGGDPIYDDEHPNLAGLCPVATKFGRFRQFHTSAQNDYIYSLFLTGDWGGQRKVVKHFKKTGTPSRLLPMNIYYHFYSGIKQVSLDACETAFAYLREGNYAGLFASEYVSVAEDFYKTRIWKEGDAFFVENDGLLRTVRFKNKVVPDIEKSEGVLGYLHYEGQTYIHLSGEKRRKIVLSSEPVRFPYLKQGTYRADGLSASRDSLSLYILGFGKAYFEFGGLDPSRSHSIKILDQNGKKILDEHISSDDSGFLHVSRNLPPPVNKYKLILKEVGGI